MSLQLIPPDINLDFVGKRKFFVALSTVINLAAIVLLIFVGLNYGVDFAGGSLVQLKFDRPTSADQIRKALGSLDLGEITVQDFGGSSSNQYLVRFAMVKNIGSLGKRLEGALNESYGSSNKAQVLRVETVGAKVGRDLRVDGFLAVAFATIFMGIYIALQFRGVSWSFGAGAVIALIPVLTVIGYSVHDTIIVSDRIREDSAKRRREPLDTIMNRAINETLSRTILTSGTALTVLASLLVLGGPILRPAAFTLFIGIITGTYSSIYIAGPVVLFWERGHRARGAVSRAA